MIRAAHWRIPAASVIVAVVTSEEHQNIPRYERIAAREHSVCPATPLTGATGPQFRGFILQLLLL